MIGVITNLIPIAMGFITKLVAVNMQQKAEQQKMMLENMAARESSIDKAREQANKESPMAAMNRRIIFLTILFLIVIYVTAPLFFDIKTAIPVIEKGTSILGFELTSDRTTYTIIDQGTMVKYDEVFRWAAMVVEFYVGTQAAKRT